ncbi:MAG: dihydrodipicolinate reductase C-terminal domain-containing protein [Actinomycetota bacterium]|nr:dihydrodipicolinate reductase C-terminal domain-containing protein [Actinomycetota bacterium]
MIARYFDNGEIIEMHHDKKQDAPSGTAISTSEVIADSMKFNNQRLKDFEETETVGVEQGEAL